MAEGIINTTVVGEFVSSVNHGSYSTVTVRIHTSEWDRDTQKRKEDRYDLPFQVVGRALESWERRSSVIKPGWPIVAEPDIKLDRNGNVCLVCKRAPQIAFVTKRDNTQQAQPVGAAAPASGGADDGGLPW